MGVYVTGGIHTPSLLAAMRERAAFLADNPHIKPTVLERAFLEAHHRRQLERNGSAQALPSPDLSKVREGSEQSAKHLLPGRWADPALPRVRHLRVDSMDNAAS